MSYVVMDRSVEFTKMGNLRFWMMRCLMSRFSYSQIQMYKRCKLQYRYKYIDKLPAPVPETTASMVIWTTVHLLLERCYEAAQTWTIWTKSKFLNQLELIRERKKEQFYYVFTGTLRVGQAWFLCRQYASTYYDQFFWTEWEVLWTETKLQFSLTWPEWEQYQMVGFIDRVDKIWSEQIALIDYKTWRWLQTLRQSRKEQLSLYSYWYDKLYWEEVWQYRWVVYALWSWKAYSIDISRDSLEQVERDYWIILNEIQTNYFRYQMWWEDCFAPTKGSYCKYCPRKSICPKWN